jgi:hypothetical protein
MKHAFYVLRSVKFGASLVCAVDPTGLDRAEKHTSIAEVFNRRRLV